MKDTDKLAANAADPHQYDDNQRHWDYLSAIGEYCQYHDLFTDDRGFCPECERDFGEGWHKTPPWERE